MTHSANSIAGVLPSALESFAFRRSISLVEVDQKVLDETQVYLFENWAVGRPLLSKALARSEGEGVKLLAEVKKKSPSMGELSTRSAPELCAEYLKNGASGISVLVDPVHFGGHVNDLSSSVATFPATAFLYKDFVFSAYQVYSAKCLGASAILLMTQLLDPIYLKDLFALASELNLEPFVEVHSAEQLELALCLKAPIIGINSRDFYDPAMRIDLCTAPRILHQVLGQSGIWPKDSVLVAQSGLSSGKEVLDLQFACPVGLPHAVQIGSALSSGEGKGLISCFKTK